MASNVKVVNVSTPTPLDESLNQFIAADSSLRQVKKVWGRVRYTGSVWEVVSTTSNAGSMTLAFASNKLGITVSGFSKAPQVQVTPVGTAAAYWVKGYATSSTNVDVLFFNASSPGTQITTPDSSMDFNIEIMGD
jgi:hypothetical protein